MSTILLSIRPEYVEKILAGTKKYEYRRHLAKSDVHKMLIYCTSPVMKVVAEAEVCEKVTGTPISLWKKTKHESGIAKKAYLSYFQGCTCAHAYRLGKVKVFRRPKKLEDYGIKSAPQSLVYIK